MCVSACVRENRSATAGVALNIRSEGGRYSRARALIPRFSLSLSFSSRLLLTAPPQGFDFCFFEVHWLLLPLSFSVYIFINLNKYFSLFRSSLSSVFASPSPLHCPHSMFLLSFPFSSGLCLLSLTVKKYLCSNLSSFHK